MSHTISVCMIVKNEEKLIGNCLSSVKEIADEIVVVDTGSTDRTVKIAERFGARILYHKWDGNYGRAQNVFVKAATGDWILALDGDEAIAQQDLNKIKKLIRRRAYIGYRLTIRNYTNDYDLMWNWYPNDQTYPAEEKFSRCPGWMRTYRIRLFRKLPGVAFNERDSAHASPIESLRKLEGKIEDRDDVVIHHFQYLKGKNLFIASKQDLRLANEIQHVKKYPREHYPYLNVAKTLFATNKDDEAIKYLAKVVKLNPAFYEAYQLWGMIELENGRLASAEEKLRKAIEINPKSADVWAILGMSLIENEKHIEGIKALKKALRIHPTHLLAHNSLGIAFEETGNYEKAQEEYKIALRLHPHFKPAKANLARLNRIIERQSNSSKRAKR